MKKEKKYFCDRRRKFINYEPIIILFLMGILFISFSGIFYNNIVKDNQELLNSYPESEYETLIQNIQSAVTEDVGIDFKKLPTDTSIFISDEGYTIKSSSTLIDSFCDATIYSVVTATFSNDFKLLSLERNFENKDDFEETLKHLIRADTSLSGLFSAIFTVFPLIITIWISDSISRKRKQKDLKTESETVAKENP